MTDNKTAQKTAAARVASVVVAAGAGQRIGGAVAKPYRTLGSSPLLLHALTRLANYGLVQPVIREADYALYQQIIGKNQAGIRPPVFGGATRGLSVLAGLKALRDTAPDIVLIHDGARPFIPPDLVKKLIEALSAYEGAAPALPITDTLKTLDQEKISTIDRTNVFRIQTPQAFHYESILRAYEESKNMDMTDDLALFEKAGKKALLISGDPRNIKITHESDFEEFYRFHHPMRMGLGVDAHRFGDGDHIWLGGHRVAHDHGIAAHSDGDVVLHALADAILGAAANEDLGHHFPSSDPQWRHAQSHIFLDHAAGLLKKAGFEIINADITIICAKPAIAPHRQAIRQKIAQALKIGIQKISIKATTTDGMGLTGNNEGIAAQAIISARVLRQ